MQGFNGMFAIFRDDGPIDVASYELEFEQQHRE